MKVNCPKCNKELLFTPWGGIEVECPECKSIVKQDGTIVLSWPMSETEDSCPEYGEVSKSVEIKRDKDSTITERDKKPNFLCSNCQIDFALEEDDDVHYCPKCSTRLQPIEKSIEDQIQEMRMLVSDDVWNGIKKLSLPELSKLLSTMGYTGDQLACEMGKDNRNPCFCVYGLTGGLILFPLSFFLEAVVGNSDVGFVIRELITLFGILGLLYLGGKEAGSKGFCRVLTGLILVAATVCFIATMVDDFQKASEERSLYRSYY